jgi:cbb3-type cytochrome oxidase maturation protein
MNEATMALGAMSLGILAVFVGLLVWGLKSGQFKDTEQTKYQIFRRDRDRGDGRTSE